MSYSDFDKKHWQNTLAYMRGTSRMFDKMVDRVVRLYSGVPTDMPFDINDHPGLKKGVEIELRRLAGEIQNSIGKGINNEWILANNKNDEVIESILKGRPLPPKLETKWMGRNLASLAAFKKRQDAGLGLSDRVWNIVKGQSVDIERQMALGIYEGKSAASLATDMKQYLRNPDKLFRRVRDEAGNLKLSKAARDFHPGRGVYRSSYKNALRLTRTETNKSYQQADNERWKQQDFVLGIEVQRSNVDYDCDICDAGVGKYPKDYEWDLWHPNCRCRAVPITASEEETMKYIDAIFEDKEGEFEFKDRITEFPDKMKDFQERTGFQHYGHESELGMDKAAEKLMARAARSSFEVDELGNNLAGMHESIVTPVNLKTKASIMRKARSDYDGAIAKVRDSVRSTVVSPEANINAIIADMKKDARFISIKSQIASENTLGYSGTLANVWTKNGVIGEIQVNTARMIYAKEKPDDAVRILGIRKWGEIRRATGKKGGLGHVYYEEYRELNAKIPYQLKRRQEIEKLSKAYYKFFQ